MVLSTRVTISPNISVASGSAISSREAIRKISVPNHLAIYTDVNHMMLWLMPFLQLKKHLLEPTLSSLRFSKSSAFKVSSILIDDFPEADYEVIGDFLISLSVFKNIGDEKWDI